MKINWFKNKKNRIFFQYIDSNYPTIEVQGGECRWNFQCHYNVVHEALKKDDDRIALVVYFDDGIPVVHFINYENDEFVDNTLGEWSRYYDYHFVKFIYKQDFKRVHYTFDYFKNTVHRMMPWYIRWFSNKIY